MTRAADRELILGRGHRYRLRDAEGSGRYRWHVDEWRADAFGAAGWRPTAVRGSSLHAVTGQLEALVAALDAAQLAFDLEGVA